DGKVTSESSDFFTKP
nr:type II keratin, NvK8 {C-terminal} [newts, cultured blastema cells, Peptide Partial, 15 aa] [Salamandridae]